MDNYTLDLLMMSFCYLISVESSYDFQPGERIINTKGGEQMQSKAIKMIMGAFLCVSLLSMTMMGVVASPYDENQVDDANMQPVIGPNIQEILDLLDEAKVLSEMPVPDEYWKTDELMDVFIQKIDIGWDLVYNEALEGAYNKVTYDMIPKLDKWVVDDTLREDLNLLFIEIQIKLGIILDDDSS